MSWDPGAVCQIDEDNLPQSFWTYPALCFTVWGFSVPFALIIGSIGILMMGKAERKQVWKFALGTLGTFLFISFANGPMPHIPFLFGIGGTIMLVLYFLILWKNAAKFTENIHKLTAYTFLMVGFWFVCGLGSRQYQPAMGRGESPIDIMTYFVLAMWFFWLSERKTKDTPD